jgi:hypothetical protein
MLGPMLQNPIITSAGSGSVKQAEASEWESHKRDSDQWLCKMAGNSHSPIYSTYSMRPKFSILGMQRTLILINLYVLAAKTGIKK